VLWWEIYRIVDQKRPPYLLLENVDRLLKSPASQRGRDFGIILGCLHNLGYAVEWRVINAADYGNSQRRRRVFIFAYHNSTTHYNRMQNIENLTEIISKDGLFARQFPVIAPEHQPEEKITHLREENSQVDIQNLSDNYQHKFENSGVMIGAKILTLRLTPNSDFLPQTLRSVLENNVEDSFYLTDAQYLKATIEKNAKSRERIKSDGFVYKFSEGAIPFPEPLDAPSRTMLTAEGKVSRTSHIILDPNTNRHRFITPKECERLNGFEDDWTNTGMTNSQRYFCMGNALVVPVITRIAEGLNTIIESEL
jgi:DNA (cytosine-5)-methyltransferase 1